jgi:hypothetical protein
VLVFDASSGRVLLGPTALRGLHSTPVHVVAAAVQATTAAAQQLASLAGEVRTVKTRTVILGKQHPTPCSFIVRGGVHKKCKTINNKCKHRNHQGIERQLGLQTLILVQAAHHHFSYRGAQKCTARQIRGVRLGRSQLCLAGAHLYVADSMGGVPLAATSH